MNKYGLLVRLKELPEWIWDRITLVAYLIINGDTVAAKAIQIAPNEKFFKVIAEHVDAYIKDGKMPPEPIATAILNFADDLMANGKMTIRTGDYIAIQNHIRKK